MSSAPMCSVMSAVDCCSDCRSVLTARNSMPATSASTMRLTALTPAPPTPTTRITGCPTVAGVAGADARARVGRVRRRSRPARIAGAVHHVLGDLRGEGVAQALLRRGHVRAPRAAPAARRSSAGCGRPLSRGWVGVGGALAGCARLRLRRRRSGVGRCRLGDRPARRLPSSSLRSCGTGPRAGLRACSRA